MPPSEAVKHIPWNEAMVPKRAPLSERWNSQQHFTVPFYPHWEIFEKEPETCSSVLTFMWSISLPLSATTGALTFLEEAIQRWPTLERMRCSPTQSEEMLTKEQADCCSYKNSYLYRQCWEEWLYAGQDPAAALSLLAKKGLFTQDFQNQQRVKEFRKFSSNQTRIDSKDKRPRMPNTNDRNKEGKGSKRSRSVGQTDDDPHARHNTSHDNSSHVWTNQGWQQSPPSQQDFSHNRGNWQQRWEDTMAETSQRHHHYSSTSASSHEWRSGYVTHPYPTPTQSWSNRSSFSTSAPRSQSSTAPRNKHSDTDRKFQ